MPTRMNPMAGRYFNDPNFASALSNLASAFAPPSAEEALGWSQLQGQNTQNDALGQLMASAEGNPDILGGVAAGGWTPNQGFENFRMGRANERYATDVGASTTLATNASNNETRLRSELLGAAVDPSGRQGLDASMMSAILGFDTTGFTPAGPVAPTEAQVLGRNLDVQLGGIDGLAEALAADGVGASSVVTDEGTRMMPTGLAALRGAEPFVNRGAEAALRPVTLISPEGQQIPGNFDPSSGRYSLADGTPVPPGFTASSLAQPQGSNEEIGITPSNVTDFNRVQSTIVTSNLLIGELERLIGSRAGAAGVPGTLQMLGQDFVQVVRELGAAFVDNPDALVSQDDMHRIAGLGANYDPVFRQIRSGMLQLAYLNAQRDNPRGEVSRFALERQIAALGQGALGNDQSVLAALSMSRGANERALAGAEALVGNRGATPPPAAPPPAAGGSRVRFDAEGNRIP